MRCALTLALVTLTAGTHGVAAAQCSQCRGSCNECRRQECVPECKATWGEKKTAKPEYSITCEYACVRDRDPWHAPPPECRRTPPCGAVVVKKRLYKTTGPEKIERVPKYEVKMVPAEPCDCDTGHAESRLCWWNPIAFLRRCASWW